MTINPLSGEIPYKGKYLVRGGGLAARATRRACQSPIYSQGFSGPPVRGPLIISLYILICYKRFAKYG